MAKLEHNRRQREDVRLFEVGKGYRPEEKTDRGEPAEVHHLALAWASPPVGKKARFDANRFSQLHGVLDDLLSHLGLASPCWGDELESPSWAHPARRLGAFWSNAKQPGVVLAELEPGIARSLGLEGELGSDVAVAEVSIDALLAAPRRESSYAPIPRYPGVKVDVAVALDADTPAAAVVEAIEKAGKGQVNGVELFDLYRGREHRGGPQIPRLPRPTLGPGPDAVRQGRAEVLHALRASRERPGRGTAQRLSHVTFCSGADIAHPAPRTERSFGSAPSVTSTLPLQFARVEPPVIL